MLHFSIFVPHKYLSILEFEAITFSLDQNMEWIWVKCVWLEEFAKTITFVKT